MRHQLERYGHQCTTGHEFWLKAVHSGTHTGEEGIRNQAKLKQHLCKIAANEDDTADFFLIGRIVQCNKEKRTVPGKDILSY